jgi:subtilisin-like proprotein convertase family protein
LLSRLGILKVIGNFILTHIESWIDYMKNLTLLALSLSLIFSAIACDTAEELTDKPDTVVEKPIGGKVDAWNSTNNPTRFKIEFDYNAETLNSQTVGRAAQTPWPSDYWSYYQDSTNVRYKGIQELSPVEKYDKAFNRWTPDMELIPMEIYIDCGMSDDSTILNTRDAYYDHLGPAADWQHRNKGHYKARNGIDDDGDGVVDDCGGDDYDGIESWWGLCHAWAPAAIIEPEPLKSVTINDVTFTVSDIKALIITMYDKNSALMLGGRCNEKEMERDEEGRIIQDECRDTNAGSFHVVITNLLGIQKRAFAEDRTAGYQVWNQPVLGYQILESTELREEEAMEFLDHEGEKYTEVFDSPEAVKWYYTRMDVDYITESSADEDGPLTEEIGKYTKTDHYEYIIEVNEAGNVVGGEWLDYSQVTHPDFLWLPISRRGGNPFIKYATIKNIIELSRKSDDPVGDENLTDFGGDVDVAIPDNDASGVDTLINIDEDITIASIKVKFDIEHTYIGDLKVVLTKGDFVKVLHDRTGSGDDDISEIIELEGFEGQSAKGEWKLSISDNANIDTGSLKNFSIYVTTGSTSSAPETKTYESTDSVTIPDNSDKGAESVIVIEDTQIIKNLTVSVNILHTYLSDIVVTLVHEGGEQILHDHEGGSDNDLVKTFEVGTFDGLSIKGDWKLIVIDNAKADTGTIVDWSIKAEF